MRILRWNRRGKFAAALLLAAGWSGSASALPAHRRLWERKYGYPTSCAICHVKGGGSDRTGYGEDFQRFGMTPGAFKAVEDRDSDGDGFKNNEEIRAKSNPGDPRSTPKSPGDWLQKIEEAMLPMEQLRKLFPGVDRFSSLEGTLHPDQVGAVEGALGGRISEEDTVPIFYFAVQKQGGKLQRTGVALFSTSGRDPQKLIVAVGVDLSGRVTCVLLVKNRLDRRLEDKAFLDQFQGKTAADLAASAKGFKPAEGLPEESARVAESVNKALLVIRAVFEKNRPGGR